MIPYLIQNQSLFDSTLHMVLAFLVYAIDGATTTHHHHTITPSHHHHHHLPLIRHRTTHHDHDTTPPTHTPHHPAHHRSTHQVRERRFRVDRGHRPQGGEQCDVGRAWRGLDRAGSHLRGRAPHPAPALRPRRLEGPGGVASDDRAVPRLAARRSGESQTPYNGYIPTDTIQRPRVPPPRHPPAPPACTTPPLAAAPRASPLLTIGPFTSTFTTIHHSPFIIHRSPSPPPGPPPSPPSTFNLQPSTFAKALGWSPDWLKMDIDEELDVDSWGEMVLLGELREI